MILTKKPMKILSLFSPVTGILTLCCFALLYIPLSMIMIIIFAATYLVPHRQLRLRLQYYCMPLFSFAWHCFYGVAKVFRLWRWQPPTQPELKRDGWYLVICNHSSWLDILIAGIFFGYKIAPLKFFLKKELSWSLPLGGQLCYLAGFPFLSRNANKRGKRSSRDKMPSDVQTAKEVCSNLAENPSTLIIFPEGTRYSSEKNQKQRAPYKSLLKPKSVGIATVVNEMHHKLDGIIDLTLKYTPNNTSLWSFLCGKLKKIDVHYRVIPITPDLIGQYRNDKDYRKRLQSWLNERWSEKDLLMQEMTNDS